VVVAGHGVCWARTLKPGMIGGTSGTSQLWISHAISRLRFMVTRSAISSASSNNNKARPGINDRQTAVWRLDFDRGQHEEWKSKQQDHAQAG